MGKGEIAHNEQFLLFPQCFVLNQIIVSPFVHIFDIISLFVAELKMVKLHATRFLIYSHAPALIDWEYKVFALSICLSAKNFNIGLSF